MNIRRFLRRPFVRILAIVAVVMVLLTGYVVWANTRPLPGPMGEVIGPNEDVQMAQAISAAVMLADQDHHSIFQATGDDTHRRDVHGKTPGCIKATFNVKQAPGRFRYGLFSEPASYEAWIRFSNGNHQIKPDTDKDVHGVAIKVMGLRNDKFGPGLLDAGPDESTQDFVMMDGPTYFFRGAEAYSQFSDMLHWGVNRAKYTPGWVPSFLRPDNTNMRDIYPFFGFSWNPGNWNIRSFLEVMKAQKSPPPTPLHTRYYSASAYALGPQQFAKYGIRPCDPNYLKDAPKVPRTDTFLHDAMKATLSSGGWCFEFGVQLQVPGKNMPVEDTTIEWRESDSPFVTVATLDIPKQEFDSRDQQCFCENLAFNPWHALPEHRPAGFFNRVRKAVYQEDARYRRTRQGAPQQEPRANHWALDPPCREPMTSVGKAVSPPRRRGAEEDAVR